ncbi:SIR2 family NAD-dependent protein deacylase [Pseudaquabacterium rugosum]|uniref:SIR2 family protein n=1 Tax=Pseudaquabacterium rugosum TaxID=2984194 RepID=A0ABU9B9D4_9BURK
MSHTTVTTLPEEVAAGLQSGVLAPYLGPGLLGLCATPAPPADPLSLVGVLTARSSVPGKIRNRLTAAAQYIENFKHRKTLVAAMTAAYAQPAEPSALHRWIAGLPAPLIVDVWYDDTLRTALAGRDDWAEVQGLSQSEHFGTWTGWYAADGSAIPDPPDAATVLYKPWGGHAPAANFLVSDTDFVEVLTEIDIQTPIPEPVQQRRASLGFVFLGCRFNDQLTRAFARQIMKRSAGPHFAVLAEEPSRMEARFFEEQGITRIALPLAEVAAQLVDGAAVPA